MSIESITNEYKIRNGLDELSNYDNKLINAIFKLRNGYGEELKKRKCSVFLKEPIIVSVFDKKNKNEKNENKVNSIICEAVQMNGNNCKAKAKHGEKFCGRHSKK